MTPEEYGRRAQQQATEAWQRLQWANRDGFAMHEWMLGLAQRRPWEFVVDPSLGNRPWEVRLRRVVSAEEERELLLEVSRIFGSFLDHSRAALNYLAVGLAHLDLSRGANVDVKPSRVEFPIYQSRRLFKDENKLKSFSPEILARVEAVQPFGRAKSGLWRLHQLAAGYRHSLIHPARVSAVRHSHMVTWGDVPAPKAWIKMTAPPYEHGDVVLRIAAPANLQGRPITVTPGIDLAIDAGNEGLVRVMVLVNSITRDAGEAADEIGSYFFEAWRDSAARDAEG